MPHQSTLSSAIVSALATANPHEKARATRDIVAAWRANHFTEIGRAPQPDRSARPAKRTLLPPRGVPRHRITAGSPGRIALLHTLA